MPHTRPVLDFLHFVILELQTNAFLKAQKSSYFTRSLHCLMGCWSDAASKKCHTRLSLWRFLWFHWRICQKPWLPKSSQYSQYSQFMVMYIPQLPKIHENPHDCTDVLQDSHQFDASPVSLEKIQEFLRICVVGILVPNFQVANMIRWTLEIRLMDLGNMEIYFSVSIQSFFCVCIWKKHQSWFLGRNFWESGSDVASIAMRKLWAIFCAWFLEMCKFLHGPAFWGSQKDIFSFKR